MCDPIYVQNRQNQRQEVDWWLSGWARISLPRVVTTEGDRFFFWEERMMKCSGIRQMVTQLLECTTNHYSELLTLKGELCSMSYNLIKLP